MASIYNLKSDKFTDYFQETDQSGPKLSQTILILIMMPLLILMMWHTTYLCHICWSQSICAVLVGAVAHAWRHTVCKKMTLLVMLCSIISDIVTVCQDSAKYRLRHCSVSCNIFDVNYLWRVKSTCSIVDAVHATQSTHLVIVNHKE